MALSPLAVGPPPASTPSLRHVLGRLAVVEARAARAEAMLAEGGDEATLTRGFRRMLGMDPTTDPLDVPETAARLAAVEAAADAAEAAGATLRLRRLARHFGLTDLDVEVLLTALAPEVDTRVELRYRRLNGEPAHGSGRATPGLALLLSHLPGAAMPARLRLAEDAPLISAGLVSVLPRDRPWLTRPLEVPQRVVAHLLGHDPAEPLLLGCLAEVPATPGPAAEAIATAVVAGVRLVHLRAPRGSVGAGAAVAALEHLGAAPVVVDATRLPGAVPDGEVRDGAAPVGEVARAAARDARLRGAGLIVDGIDALTTSEVRAFTALPGVVVLVGSRGYDPEWSTRSPLLVEAEPVSAAQRTAWWAKSLGAQAPASAASAADAAELDLAAATGHLAMDRRQITRAAETAVHAALAAGRPVSAADLQQGARAQNGAGLDRLSRRIRPRATFDDLVLAEEALAQLHHLVARWRHRELVLGGWGMARGAGRGRGVTAMFAGESGTGKTLSAEILAGELGLDLYVVELSTVIDKYVGETAKNLERIFTEADRVNGVLLFDEADALFGKRSAVSDAQDRHANVEVAYLLQRFEAFDGVAILTTNLAGNLDDAFLRRLDVIIDFPRPEPDQRLALWQAKLPGAVPRSEDVDLAALAERFPLTGSDIENIAIAAAYEAADTGGPLTMAGLVRAVVREHRKLGRHLTASDLGPFAG